MKKTPDHSQGTGGGPVSVPLEKQRRGFILTNGSGAYIVSREQKNEIEELLRTGWRIAFIRPITTSMAVKLNYLPPEILRQGVFSYSLCILENKNVLLPPSETREKANNSPNGTSTRG